MEGQLCLSSSKGTGTLCSLAPGERHGERVQEEEEPLKYRCWSEGGGQALLGRHRGVK